MKLLGFSFTKISIEKKKEVLQEVKINNSIDVSDIQEVEQDLLKSKEDIFSVRFKYSVDYAPDFARIDMEGTMMVSVDPKLSKEVVKQWKDKKMPEEFQIPLFNVVFKKAGVKAVGLEEEFNLPLHFQIPVLRKEESKK